MDKREQLEKECEFKNSVVDDNSRENIDCPICLNREHIFYVDYEKESVFAKPCICVKERNVRTYLRKSGLLFVENEYTFDNFFAEEQWQKHIKKTALEYIEDGYKTSGFYMGGQVGAGKSHICSAIAIHLMKQGIPCKYVRWRDFMAEIKSLVNSEEYNDEMAFYTNIKLLYIDDFLKAPNNPTDADLKLAYDLINGRYSHGLNTIISSEYILNKIRDFDEALHSRLVELTETKYCLSISRDSGKDQRIKQ